MAGRDAVSAYHGLAVLEAYPDESEDERKTPRVFVVAGWLSDGPAWRDFEGAWRQVLERPQFAVSEFKASDCENQQGEFKGWSLEKRDDFRNELVTVLLGSEIGAVTATITLDESVAKTAKHSDYLGAIEYCLRYLTVMTDRFPHGERVAYMLDERAKVVGEVEKIRKEMKKDPRTLESLRRRVGPLAFDDSKEVLPIQAADLLAYEVMAQRRNELAGVAEHRRRLIALVPKIVKRKTFHWDAAAQVLHDYDFPGRVPPKAE